MAIQETRDKHLLRKLFARDPIGAIYMLGDLDESDFRHCRWYVDGERGVLLIYSGLSVPVVLPFGDATALVQQVPLPVRFYTKLTDAERRLFIAWQLSEAEELYVMGLDALRPVPPPNGLGIFRVNDAGPIATLYAHYPGNFFAPERVPAGV